MCNTQWKKKRQKKKKSRWLGCSRLQKALDASIPLVMLYVGMCVCVCVVRSSSSSDLYDRRQPTPHLLSATPSTSSFPRPPAGEVAGVFPGDLPLPAAAK